METLLIEAANQDGVADVVIPNSIQTMYCSDVNFEIPGTITNAIRTSQGLRVLQVNYC